MRGNSRRRNPRWTWPRNWPRKNGRWKWRRRGQRAGSFGGGWGGHLEGLGLGEVDGAPQRVRLGRQLEQVDKQPEPAHQRSSIWIPEVLARFLPPFCSADSAQPARRKTAANPAKSHGRETAERDSGGYRGRVGAHVSMSSSFSMSLLPRASWWKCSSGVRITLHPRIHTHRISRYKTHA